MHLTHITNTLVFIFSEVLMLAIKNGKTILENGIVDGKAVLFTDKIVGIVDECDIPADATVIDAEGGYVSPGLIELHIHGYLGRDVCDASEESMRIISKVPCFSRCIRGNN